LDKNEEAYTKDHSRKAPTSNAHPRDSEDEHSDYESKDTRGRSTKGRGNKNTTHLKPSPDGAPKVVKITRNSLGRSKQENPDSSSKENYDSKDNKEPKGKEPTLNRPPVISEVEHSKSLFKK